MKKYNLEEKQEICELYQSGLTQAEVSEKTGVPVSTISKFMKELGVQGRQKGTSNKSTRRKFSDEDINEIIRLYVEEEKTTVEIASRFGTYNTSIKRVLERYNIPIRGVGVARRTIKLKDIKSKEGTDDFDYFIGLLATDGCITKNNIVLDFAEQNKELLDYWNEFLGNKCNITISIHKIYKTPQYRIQFANPEIKEFLSTYGIVERKT